MLTRLSLLCDQLTRRLPRGLHHTRRPSPKLVCLPRAGPVASVFECLEEEKRKSSPSHFSLSFNRLDNVLRR